MIDATTALFLGVFSGSMIGYVIGFMVGRLVYKSPSWPE
jgi:hypothetical protein